MKAKLISFAFFIAILARGQDLPKFMGRQVTVITSELDDLGFPKGPASVCIEGPPQRQCYTAPEDFGAFPTVEVIQVQKDIPALLFSASSGGVSGYETYFALLRSGTDKDLDNLFVSALSLSNQSQIAFWNDSTISDEPIVLTADAAAGPNEVHYGEHRYEISAYVRRHDDVLDLYYFLEDRYMTAQKYDLENADILNSEKPDILARLRRAKSFEPKSPDAR
ncbi:MAG: hypothetical protein ACRD4E_18165 [Bryobacteraceae bacterium]